MSAPEIQSSKRWIYLSLGWFFFALGIVGVVLPVMPTSPFMILAVWAFSKSSVRFEQWLLNHRHFGPGLRRWREHRVIPLKAKVFSLGAMCITLTVSIISGKIPWWGIGAQVLLLAVAAAVILRFPSRAPE